MCLVINDAQSVITKCFSFISSSSVCHLIKIQLIKSFLPFARIILRNILKLHDYSNIINYWSFLSVLSLLSMMQYGSNVE